MKVRIDVSRFLEKALDNMVLSDFLKAEELLRNNRRVISEAIKGITSTELGVIMDKLSKDESLTVEEIDYLRLWIAGDAESYVNAENKFKDQLINYKQLKNGVAIYEDKDLSLDDLVKLQGLLDNLLRVSKDIYDFLKKKEKIDRFALATKNISDINKGELKDILVEQLNCPDL